MSQRVDNVVIAHIDGTGDLEPTILGANIVTLSAAVITLVLRFISRRISKSEYWWDDWLLLPALVCAVGFFATTTQAFPHGFGKYIGEVTFAKLRRHFLGIFVGELIYAYAIGFTKFSIICLLSRLFKQRWMRYYCYALGLINAGWLIACTILVCFQCQPTSGFWDRDKPATCNLDLKKTYLGLGIVTVVTDVALVALPTYICWHLCLTTTKRLMVCGVFFTGLFVTVASAIRMKMILNLDLSGSINSLNITWNFGNMVNWSGVEINMAIVSSCLPLMKPLVAKIIPSTMVPTALRKPRQANIPHGIWVKAKPSQPDTSTAVSSKSRTPVTAGFLRRKDASPSATIVDHGALEAQKGSAVVAERPATSPDQAGKTSLEIRVLVSTRVETYTRPPTPPPKDKVSSEMTTTPKRPLSWNNYVDSIGKGMMAG